MKVVARRHPHLVRQDIVKELFFVQTMNIINMILLRDIQGTLVPTILLFQLLLAVHVVKPNVYQMNLQP